MWWKPWTPLPNAQMHKHLSLVSEGSPTPQSPSVNPELRIPVVGWSHGTTYFLVIPFNLAGFLLACVCACVCVCVHVSLTLSHALSHILPSYSVVWLLSGIDGHTFRSACLPRWLEAEWIFGGVKYQYGGNKEGKWCFFTGWNYLYSRSLEKYPGKSTNSREACLLQGLIPSRSWYA